MWRPVDAIVLDYQLGLLDGGVVAAEIRKVKPQVPPVMLVEERLPGTITSPMNFILVKRTTCRNGRASLIENHVPTKL
jgi:hypothetical protein